MGGWSHWDASDVYAHPKITASTPCLTCGKRKGNHKYRHPFRPRFPDMTAAGTQINSETMSVGIGPFEFDVEMARDKGWSKRRVVRAVDELEKLAVKLLRRAPSRDLDELKRRRRA